MTKDEYLGHRDVSWLRRGLADIVAGGSLTHRYFDFDRRRWWSCKSAYDAADNYYFPVEDKALHTLWDKLHPGCPLTGSLLHTTALLEELRGRLRKAVDNTDEAAAMESCEMILRWGGVIKGNNSLLNQLHQAKDGLVGYLLAARALLTADDDYSKHKAEVEPGLVLFCSAGFTKIYSLLLDEFVIYDSRVAATLGMLIVHLCRESGRYVVQPYRRFLWMPSRTKPHPHLHKRVPSQRRDPRSGLFTFSTQRRHGAYLTNNIRAGWLLSDVSHRSDIASWPQKLIAADTLRSSGTTTNLTSHQPHLSPLRALEAALFMIGYDLSGNADYPANSFAPRDVA